MNRPTLHRIALFARRRYRSVLAVTAALVAVCLLLAFRLRFDTDILALLPREEPVVEAFREALEEFGSLDYLLVAVRIPEGAVLDPYEMFVDRLGRRLTGLEEFEEVSYRIGEVEELVQTFLPTAMLFLEREGLERVAERVSDESLRERAGELRRLISTPQAMVVKDLIKLDPLGLATIFLDRVTAERGGLSVDWASGYLLSRDHRMLLVLGKPARPPQDVDFSRALVAAVESEIEGLRGEWSELAGPEAGPPPETVLGGRYVIGLGDALLIRRDVVTNLLTSMIGVLLLFLFAFRRAGTLLYAFLPLSVGLALTFGFSAVAFGALNSATSGTAALLIGLGIDFVIVSYGRFVEERQRGGGLPEALATMSGSSGRAVVVGAVTSAATFYAFGVTDFTGLYQMGFLTGTGILFCMLAVLFLLPALLSWSEDRHSRRARAPRLFLHGMGSGQLIRFSFDHPRSVLAVGLAITVAALAASFQLRFEDSIQAMRPRGNPGVEVRREVAARFGAEFEQMMLILGGDTPEQVVARADRAAAAARRLVEEGVLAGVDSVSTLIPPADRQRAALEWLERARGGPLDAERIRRTFAAALGAEGLRFEAFAAGLELFERAIGRRAPLGVEELASSPRAAGLLDRYLRGDEKGWRGVVYLQPPAGMWRREPPPQAVRLAEEAGPDAVLTGANVVSEFLRRRVLKDAKLAAALGFVLVGILLWLDYRRLSDTLLSLAPLMVGIVWMLGAMALLDLQMNFMNIFVTTMIIGIGVDYGVHMIHRHRELRAGGRSELGAGLVETGKAIVLAALSTVVGFGSLSGSHYPGLSSMGVVAILGAVSTGLVAITLLPAYLGLRQRDRPPGGE